MSGLRKDSQYCGKGLCEANAFNIEIRRLKNQLKTCRNDTLDEVIQSISDNCTFKTIKGWVDTTANVQVMEVDEVAHIIERLKNI